MKLFTAATWLLVTLCTALTFTFGILSSTCAQNDSLHNTISTLDRQHSAAMNTNTQDLSECSLRAEMWHQGYTYLLGKLSGLRLSEGIATEVDRLEKFRMKLEKGYMQSRRGRR